MQKFVVMTEDKLKKLVELQKALSEEFNSEAANVKSEDFSKLDGLNQDLTITECNMIQALLGVISIRIGLNIQAIKRNQEEVSTELPEVGMEPGEDQQEQAADETPSTQTEPESE